MNILDKYRPMNIWVMPPHRNLAENYGAVTQYTNANMKLRFDTISELSFDVPQKLYDTESEKWIDNPTYNNLEKGNTLYTDWDNCANSIPLREVGDKHFYIQSPTGKGTYKNVHFSLKDDDNDGVSYTSSDVAKLRQHISCDTQYAYIDDYGKIQSGYQNLTEQGYDSPSRYYVSSPFYEVENGDIIEFYGFRATPTNKYFAYKGFFYSQQDEDTVLKTPRFTYSDGGYFLCNSTTGIQRYQVSGLPDGKKSYFRIAVYLNDASYDGGIVGNVDIYSHKQYLKSADSSTSEINWNIRKQLSNQYWVIKNVSIDNSQKVSVKTVTAYSYESVLSDRQIVLDGTVLNLYTPPPIKAVIESDNFRVADPPIISTGSKFMQTLSNDGILNQILDCLPNWSMGYISPELMGKYRTFDETKAYNIYSLLVDDVQSLFQCFIIFDTTNLTINAYTKDDILSDSKLLMSYHNAIKSATISSEDTEVVTALHIHTSDDTYGISLINPLGNDIIYNFDFYMQQLGNVCGKAGVPLSTRITNWKNRIKERMVVGTYINDYGNSVKGYLSTARTFIRSNKDVIKYKSQLKTIFDEYVAKVKVINISSSLNDSGYKSHIFSTSYVETQTELEKWTAKFYGGQENLSTLLDLSAKYYNIKTLLSNAQSDYNNALKRMRAINQEVSLKGGKFINASNREPIRNFEDDELEILQYYIKEGDWTDNNATFSEEYNVDDIYNTLKDTYDKAQLDMQDCISQPSYDMDILMVNLLDIQEYKDVLKTLFLGSKSYVEVERGVWRQPVLLEIDIDFYDRAKSKMIFTTDYKRKPMELRFRDLYDSVNKISVSDNTFNYEE